MTATENTVLAPIELQPEETSAPTQAPTIPASDASLIAKSEHVINILLIGQDCRPEWPSALRYGMGVLNLCLKESFGIVVDHNVEVDFTSFTKIIDTLGGVCIYLPQGEADNHYQNIAQHRVTEIVTRCCCHIYA